MLTLEEQCNEKSELSSSRTVARCRRFSATVDTGRYTCPPQMHSNSALTSGTKPSRQGGPDETLLDRSALAADWVCSFLCESRVKAGLRPEMKSKADDRYPSSLQIST